MIYLSEFLGFGSKKELKYYVYVDINEIKETAPKMFKTINKSFKYIVDNSEETYLIVTGYDQNQINLMLGVFGIGKKQKNSVTVFFVIDSYLYNEDENAMSIMFACIEEELYRKYGAKSSFDVYVHIGLFSKETLNKVLKPSDFFLLNTQFKNGVLI